MPNQLLREHLIFRLTAVATTRVPSLSTSYEFKIVPIGSSWRKKIAPFVFVSGLSSHICISYDISFFFNKVRSAPKIKPFKVIWKNMPKLKDPIIYIKKIWKNSFSNVHFSPTHLAFSNIIIFQSTPELLKGRHLLLNEMSTVCTNIAVLSLLNNLILSLSRNVFWTNF